MPQPRLILNASYEVAIRQNLTLFALGKRPAERAIRVVNLFASYARECMLDQEIVIAGRRVA